MRMMVKGEILEIQDDYAVRMMEQGQAVPAPYAPEPKERIAASAPEEPPRNDNEGEDAPPRNDMTGETARTFSLDQVIENDAEEPENRPEAEG